MDYLPIFVSLQGRQVLVVGGGEVAARKITLLLQAGARIRVVAEHLNHEVSQWQQQGKVQWSGWHFEARHLDNIALVIAATDDDQVNRAVAEAATARQILINVVDNRELCTFIMPAIIDRSPIIVAVGSQGEAPVLTRMLREKLEAWLPHSLGKVAQVAGRWRQQVKQYRHSVGARRRFWEGMFNGRFAALITAGQIEQAETHLQQSLQQPETERGMVTLVGAGPGDAGLLTLKGLQAIQQADVVLYDHLVSEEILDLVRRDAEKICVGKRAGAHSVAQEETNHRLVTLAQAGLRVVRLKGGDPFIFGRGGEELTALAEVGIPFQVVPGITAASGATTYAGIPLTHRDHSQSVMFITGHCRPEQDVLDWSTLARARQTLAIYMGTVKAADIQQQLLAHGRAAETPVAVISRGTRADQTVRIGTLQQLTSLTLQVPSPALLVVGEVVSLHAQLSWFKPTLNTQGEMPPLLSYSA